MTVLIVRKYLVRVEPLRLNKTRSSPLGKGVLGSARASRPRRSAGAMFGAGLPTPPECTTGGLQHASCAAGAPPIYPGRAPANRQETCRSGTRAGSGDPRPTMSASHPMS